MSFRTKFQHLNEADILVIPECELKEKLPDSFHEIYHNSVTIGENEHKGIGIFSTKDYGLKLHSNFNKDLKYIIPIKVEHSKRTFNLFAVWSQVNGNYTNNLHNAIDEYQALLKDECILVGDFNSNKIWDKKSSIGNHSKTVSLLNDYGIRSAYHEYFKEEQGEETRPTFFMYHHEDKPYHIDYCFLSKGFSVIDYEVGSYKDWKVYSDHMPLSIEIKL